MLLPISCSLIFLDIILPALVISLAGGLICVFISSSIMSDREDARLRERERIMNAEYDQDPDLWGSLLDNKQKRMPLSKNKKIALTISISAVIVVTLVIIIIAL